MAGGSVSITVTLTASSPPRSQPASPIRATTRTRDVEQKRIIHLPNVLSGFIKHLDMNGQLFYMDKSVRSTGVLLGEE